MGAEVLGLVQVQVGRSNSQPPSPAASPGTLLVLRSCSWAERLHRVLGSSCQHPVPILQCRVLSLLPPPPLCLQAKECALALRLQLGYCLWLPVLCRNKGR